VKQKCSDLTIQQLDGLFAEKGVFPPELVGRHKTCFDYFLSYLEERDIHYIKSSRLV